MMGLCKSCFSSKYYGSSPDDSNVDPDAQMLIVKNNSKPILISPEAAPVKEEQEGAEEISGLITNADKLERCETGDSGTYVDDSFSKFENTKEQCESKANTEEIEHEKDLVQLTVSSVASLSGVAPTFSETEGCDQEQETVTTQISFSAGLTLIPESGDTNLISLSPNVESDKECSNIPSQNDSQSSSRKGSISSILKPTIKSRTSSFGQSCPPLASENTAVGRQFIINKVPSKSILSG